MFSRLITFIVLGAVALCAFSSDANTVVNDFTELQSIADKWLDVLDVYDHDQNATNFQAITETAQNMHKALESAAQDAKDCPPLDPVATPPVCRAVTGALLKYERFLALYLGIVFGHGHDADCCDIIKSLDAQFILSVQYAIALFYADTCGNASAYLAQLQLSIAGGLTVQCGGS